MTLVGLLIFFGALLPFISFASEPPFTDDFDSYSLGTLNGQGGWSVSGNGNVLIVDDKTYNGAKSIKMLDTVVATKTFTTSTDGIISFWYNAATGDATIFNLAKDGGENVITLGVGFATALCGETTCPFEFYTIAGGWQKYADFPINTWVNIQVKWFMDGSDFDYSFNFNFEGWQDNYNLSPHTYVSQFKMRGNNANARLDTISGEATIPTMEIDGTTPANGTTITDLADTLTIDYKNFDWDEYKGFIVNFKDHRIGAAAQSKQFLAADCDPSGTGSKTITLSDFGIDKNGQWDLTTLAFGTHLNIEGGMFLTTRGYVDFWSSELVKTPYDLIFNVAGLPSPYAFSNSETWYTENIDTYATPTAFFTAATDFLSPIFEKVGDFANGATALFNSNESYDRGYSLGEVFPLINGYIKKIDIFFGGFPLVSFLKYLILSMIAIFIVRAVMKFIPFIG